MATRAELDRTIAKAQSDFRTAEEFLKEDPTDVSAEALMKEAQWRLQQAAMAYGEFIPGRFVMHPFTRTRGASMGLGALDIPSMAGTVFLVGILGLSLWGAFRK